MECWSTCIPQDLRQHISQAVMRHQALKTFAEQQEQQVLRSSRTRATGGSGASCCLRMCPPLTPTAFGSAARCPIIWLWVLLLLCAILAQNHRLTRVGRDLKVQLVSLKKKGKKWTFNYIDKPLMKNYNISAAHPMLTTKL